MTTVNYTTQNELLLNNLMDFYKNDCYLHLEIPSFVYEHGSFFSRHTNINNLAIQLINCINNNIHTIIIPYIAKVKTPLNLS